MILNCIRCEAEFENAKFVGYCYDCQQAFDEDKAGVCAASNPRPGMHVTGKFAKLGSPQSVYNPIEEKNVCGICGGSDLDMGYGFGGGHGCGTYNYCQDCNTFLDFSEDTEE